MRGRGTGAGWERTEELAGAPPAGEEASLEELPHATRAVATATTASAAGERRVSVGSNPDERRYLEFT